MNPIPSEAGGSGAIIDRRGYILTNHHVVVGFRKHGTPHTIALELGERPR